MNSGLVCAMMIGAPGERTVGIWELELAGGGAACCGQAAVTKTLNAKTQKNESRTESRLVTSECLC
jgi:hypothetical protein